MALGVFLVPREIPSDARRTLLHGFCHLRMEMLAPQDALHLYSYLGADEFTVCGCGIGRVLTCLGNSWRVSCVMKTMY